MNNILKYIEPIDNIIELPINEDISYFVNNWIISMFGTHIDIHNIKYIGTGLYESSAIHIDMTHLRSTRIYRMIPIGFDNNFIIFKDYTTICKFDINSKTIDKLNFDSEDVEGWFQINNELLYMIPTGSIYNIITNKVYTFKNHIYSKYVTQINKRGNKWLLTYSNSDDDAEIYEVDFESIIFTTHKYSFTYMCKTSIPTYFMNEHFIAKPVDKFLIIYDKKEHILGSFTHISPSDIVNIYKPNKHMIVIDTFAAGETIFHVKIGGYNEVIASQTANALCNAIKDELFRVAKAF